MVRRFEYRSGVRCALLTTALVIMAALLSGCYSRETTDSVSGKVTLSGKPVNGQVVFVRSDGKEHIGFTHGPDGSYTILNVPKGEVTVLIKGLGPVSGNSRPSAPSRPPPVGPKPATGGVAPPARYAAPGELKLVVVGGQQVKDFELTP
jgi:hypothetical protein